LQHKALSLQKQFVAFALSSFGAENVPGDAVVAPRRLSVLASSLHVMRMSIQVKWLWSVSGV
jgi:hypothetical protein